MPFYTLAPAVSLGQMARETEAALQALFGFIEVPLVVSGHSAGRHLAARMACADIAVPIKCVVPISPLRDLTPIAQTQMNQNLGLSVEDVRQQSPALLPKRSEVEAHIWVGGAERVRLFMVS